MDSFFVSLYKSAWNENRPRLIAILKDYFPTTSFAAFTALSTVKPNSLNRTA